MGVLGYVCDFCNSSSKVTWLIASHHKLQAPRRSCCRVTSWQEDIIEMHVGACEDGEVLMSSSQWQIKLCRNYESGIYHPCYIYIPQPNSLINAISTTTNQFRHTIASINRPVYLYRGELESNKLDAAITDENVRMCHTDIDWFVAEMHTLYIRAMHFRQFEF